MSRIDRIRQTVSARDAARRAEARADEAREAKAANLPVPVDPVASGRSFREERARGGAELSAQVIGQDGQRRGLRGGVPVLQAAQNAYNTTEWSGSFDRRSRKGRQTRTDV
jgi:hypothetical protein